MCSYVGMCSLSQKLPTKSFLRKNPATAYTSLHSYTASSEKLFAQERKVAATGLGASGHSPNTGRLTAWQDPGEYILEGCTQ